MKKNDQKNLPYFREYAGVLTAFLVVIAFVLIGYFQMSALLMIGTDIKPPSDWMAAMLSLASAALGYLIGKQSNQSQADSITYEPEADPICAACGAKILASTQGLKEL